MVWSPGWPGQGSHGGAGAGRRGSGERCPQRASLWRKCPCRARLQSEGSREPNVFALHMCPLRVGSGGSGRVGTTAGREVQKSRGHFAHCHFKIWGVPTQASRQGHPLPMMKRAGGKENQLAALRRLEPVWGGNLFFKERKKRTAEPKHAYTFSLKFTSMHNGGYTHRSIYEPTHTYTSAEPYLHA